MPGPLTRFRAPDRAHWEKCFAIMAMSYAFALELLGGGANEEEELMASTPSISGCQTDYGSVLEDFLRVCSERPPLDYIEPARRMPFDFISSHFGPMWWAPEIPRQPGTADSYAPEWAVPLATGRMRK